MYPEPVHDDWKMNDQSLEIVNKAPTAVIEDRC